MNIALYVLALSLCVVLGIFTSHTWNHKSKDGAVLVGFAAIVAFVVFYHTPPLATISHRLYFVYVFSVLFAPSWKESWKRFKAKVPKWLKPAT